MTFKASHNLIQSEMKDGISTAKMTNKNGGIDIEEACINCQNPQILNEVKAHRLRLTFDCSRAIVSSN